MANDTKKLITVKADYPVGNENICLWGVQFKSDGKENPAYIAEVDADTAKSLISAKRAK